MMARITTTTQKKNTMMPGMACPATVLALAMAASYPPPPGLSGFFGGFAGHENEAGDRRPGDELANEAPGEPAPGPGTVPGAIAGVAGSRSAVVTR
jgi:hypothetical protein